MAAYSRASTPNAIKPILVFARRWLSAFLTPIPFLGLASLPSFTRDWVRFSKLAGVARPKIIDSYPCLVDRLATTPFDAHYLYQAAWLARRIAESKPSVHVDVASSALTISMLSAMCRTVFLDFRPLKVTLTGLTSVAASITRLPFADASLASVSCLHVIEHIGLGRYGDPIDPNGSHVSARELARVLAPGGKLYLSVPIGRERTCFNAHRVFSPSTITAWFAGFHLERFSYVDDDHRYVDSGRLEATNHLDYGCGLFEFRHS